MNKEQGKRSFLTFRAQLVLFGLLLVLITALTPLIIEAQRPWDELDNLIAKGNIIASQTNSSFAKSDLAKMNAFAFSLNKLAEKLPEDALIWSFNLLILEGKLPDKKEMQAELIKNELSPDFDYAEIERAFKFWQNLFDNDQEALELFKRYKKQLIQQRQSAANAQFEYADNYVMADNGQTLVFVLDSVNWYESSYPGLKFDVAENNCPYFRDYLQKGAGFYSNPTNYYYGIFPKFDTDKWGTWFSTWYAEKNENIWNNFSVDIDASHVKKLMWTIGAYIGATILAVILVLTVLTAKLSQYISRPIGNLLAGTEAVLNDNYDHLVPESGSSEFSRLIRFFNKMLKYLKERLNMMNTLEKLLSKELAEQVAKHGLVLGGQNVEITNLFTDFAGFSSITKKMAPEEVVKMLNAYYSELIPIIKKHGGFPDKFIGDAIVVIFGAPVYLENHAESALACAIELQLKMRQINIQRRKEGKPVFEMRIGLNSGEVIAGAMGSDLKLEYTSIGETTNLAQRMESGCQIGHVLIAERTFELVQGILFDGVDFEQSPQKIDVKGYSQPVSAYNIFIDNSIIKKNMEKTGTLEFYEITFSNHHIKLADKLTPAEKSKYNKIITTTLS